MGVAWRDVAGLQAHGETTHHTTALSRRAGASGTPVLRKAAMANEAPLFFFTGQVHSPNLVSCFRPATEMLRAGSVPELWRCGAHGFYHGNGPLASRKRHFFPAARASYSIRCLSPYLYGQKAELLHLSADPLEPRNKSCSKQDQMLVP